MVLAKAAAFLRRLTLPRINSRGEILRNLDIKSEKVAESQVDEKFF